MSKHMIFKGRNRVTQIYGGRHGGIDIVGDDDATIHAVRAGRVCCVQHWDGVTKTGDQSYGTLAIIEDTSGEYHYYAHMARVFVSAGDNVACDAPIGIMGDTGNTTGAHVHYEKRKGTSIGSRVNPADSCGVYNVCGTYHSAGVEPEIKIETVTVPAKQSGSGTAVYIVAAGDTLSGIAAKYGTTWQMLAAHNWIQNPDRIYPGQKINIPRTAAITSSSAAAYYPKCDYTGPSIVDGLKKIGVDASFSHRTQIASANGISSYTGRPPENVKLLTLLKSGKLKKA